MVTEKERYSFSKLSSIYVCPYSYKMTYIDHNEGIGNAFASYGTELHSIMERYAKGELTEWDLVDVYKQEFKDKIPEKFPPNRFVNLRESYYNQGLYFLQNFQGFPKQFQVVGSEVEFELDFDDWIFNGIIDLILLDEDGEYIIVDYKSKGGFKNKKEKAEYARQLYLYSLYIEKTYKKRPKELVFVMFRKNEMVRIKYSNKDLEEACKWARDTVQLIRDKAKEVDLEIDLFGEAKMDGIYKPSPDQFFCSYLCNHRKKCPFKEQEEEDG